jgi:hypothetical protein
MNRDRKTRPRMKAVEQFAKLGPVGVLKFRCTTRSERTYRCRRTHRFGVMCAAQGAYVRRRSWAGYTINTFEFEFSTGTGEGEGWRFERYRDLSAGSVSGWLICVASNELQNVLKFCRGFASICVPVEHGLLSLPVDNFEGIISASEVIGKGKKILG